MTAFIARVVRLLLMPPLSVCLSLCVLHSWYTIKWFKISKHILKFELRDKAMFLVS